MTSAHKYRSGVEKALFVLSRGFCYAPTCKNPVVSIDDGEPSVVVHIAHIRAAMKGGPRFEESMSDLERKSFPNLILLCKSHHDKVDGKDTWRNYPVDILEEWKKLREKPLADQIVGLGRLTEDDLEKLLIESTSELRAEMTSAIGRIEGVSQEVRELLESLIDEPFSRPAFDPDAVASLEHSARALMVLHDYGGILADSANALNKLADYSPALSDFSRSMKNLEDGQLWRIESALSEIRSLDIRSFQAAVDDLHRVGLGGFKRSVTQLNQEISRAERLSVSVPTRRGPASPAAPIRPSGSRSQRNIFFWGVGGGLTFVVLAQILALVLVTKIH